MKQVDYIVVGLGIAGISFCEQLQRHAKSFVAVDSGLNTATKVSGGVLNPVVLKRFTLAWKAKEQFSGSLQFYKELSEKLGEKLLVEMPVYRILNNVEEQNDWVVASDKRDLSPFISSEIIANINPNVIAPLGFGSVHSAGRIDPSVVVSKYKAYLQKNDSLLSETFDYSEFSEVSETKEKYTVRYKNIVAKRIVFAQGAFSFENPMFPKLLTAKGKLVLIPNKGEYIIISAPELQLNVLLKGPVYVIPLGNDTYKVGATYDRDNSKTETTDKAREEIVAKLKRIILCDFEIIDQEAGIRPTTIDRRPLLGTTIEKPHIAFFTGLGTHGILGAPFLSDALYNHLENNVKLPEEMDLKRWLR
ncbi:NAD(P)/FAD-dependent oxidoreductase [Ulvibacter antarcticus]|uniref:Glycine/D-amino acid oxidase-like deaminating enzyme n=1 Tax=Ulvibacter antarcticus TaxID=442714 RepID=A0A3L9Z4Z4_9FLAO|nr:FAD-binding oxidoreductase [Ulvibacter antarcticus]RMA66539.1 glycine/D-amino acid oxidase-like deaminating enzyme [Ulvibacter antarcticus]